MYERVNDHMKETTIIAGFSVPNVIQYFILTKRSLTTTTTMRDRKKRHISETVTAAAAADATV